MAIRPFGEFAIFSEDHGRTWQRGQFVPGGRDGDENQLVELADGRILMDYRQNDNASHRWMTESRDGGRTWSKPRPGLGLAGRLCDRAIHAEICGRRLQPHPLDRPERPRRNPTSWSASVTMRAHLSH